MVQMKSLTFNIVYGLHFDQSQPKIFPDWNGMTSKYIPKIKTATNPSLLPIDITVYQTGYL